MRFIRGTPTNYSQVGGAGRGGGRGVVSKQASRGAVVAVREGGGDTLIYIIGTVEELGGRRGRIYNVFNFECVTKLQRAEAESW